MYFAALYVRSFDYYYYKCFHLQVVLRRNIRNYHITIATLLCCLQTVLNNTANNYLLHYCTLGNYIKYFWNFIVLYFMHFLANLSCFENILLDLPVYLRIENI